MREIDMMGFPEMITDYVLSNPLDMSLSIRQEQDIDLIQMQQRMQRAPFAEIVDHTAHIESLVIKCARDYAEDEWDKTFWSLDRLVAILHADMYCDLIPILMPLDTQVDAEDPTRIERVPLMFFDPIRCSFYVPREPNVQLKGELSLSDTRLVMTSEFAPNVFPCPEGYWRKWSSQNNELVARLIHGANHAMSIYEKMWDVNPKIQRWCQKWREVRGAFAMLVTDPDDRPDYSTDTSAIDALIAEAAGA